MQDNAAGMSMLVFLFQPKTNMSPRLDYVRTQLWKSKQNLITQTRTNYLIFIPVRDRRLSMKIMISAIPMKLSRGSKGKSSGIDDVSTLICTTDKWDTWNFLQSLFQKRKDLWLISPFRPLAADYLCIWKEVGNKLGRDFKIPISTGWVV